MGWRFVQDMSRLQKSRALNEGTAGKGASPPAPEPPVPLDGVYQPSTNPPTASGGDSQTNPEATLPDSVSKPIPDSSIPDGVSQPVLDARISTGASNVAMEVVTHEEKMKQSDAAEPQSTKEHPDAGLEVEQPQTLQVASPKGRRRLTLQRSCSMNDLDDLCRKEERPQTPPPAQESSDKVNSMQEASLLLPLKKVWLEKSFDAAACTQAANVVS